MQIDFCLVMKIENNSEGFLFCFIFNCNNLLFLTILWVSWAAFLV